jgi:siroheme synthase-like protein
MVDWLKIEHLTLILKEWHIKMQNEIKYSNSTSAGGDVNREVGTNTLFPVFLKLEQLRVLLIGAGNAGLEKLHAIVNNAPATKIKVIAREVIDSFAALANQYETVEIIVGEYDSSYLDECDIVIAAVNDIPTGELIRNDAKQKGKLINVADKPGLCDFYLGSIVTKGNLKLAISTNGKSPTVAKRLKEIFNELLPEELDEVLNNIQQIRNKLKGDFQDKVRKLNEITKVLTEKENK